MSELITPPKNGNWAIHTGVTESALKATLASRGHRLISIKSYLSGGNRVLAAVSVEDTGVVTDWTSRISESGLKGTLKEGNLRLISLDAFTEANGATSCAAVWVKNDGVWWNWAIDLTESTLRAALKDGHGKLTCLRAYDKNEANPPAGPDRRYAAIWVKEDGTPWEYRPKVSDDDLYKQVVDVFKNEYQIVSLDAFVEGSEMRFAAVYWKNANPPGYYWFWPIEAPKLDERVRGLCCFPMDVCQSYPDKFAVAQFAYPPRDHPSAAALLTFAGPGVINAISKDLIQSVFAQPAVKNVTTEDVTIQRAVRIQAGPGGWCWFWMASLSDPNPGQVFNTGNTVPAGASPLPGGGFTYASSQPMQYSITQVEAKSASGKFQQSFACLPLTAAGGGPVAALDLRAPVFVGLQGPLEILPMTDGRRLLEIKGQVVNLSGRPMKIQGIFLRLVTPTGDTAYHAVLPLDFMVDFEANGKNLDPPVAYDPLVHEDRPLPRFRHLIEVPAAYTGGTLEVDVHVQSASPYPDVPSGTVECFSDKRAFPVSPGAILEIGSPVKGKYRWGSGPGAASWNAHYPFHERYAYDLIKLEPGDRGQLIDHKDGTTGSANEDAFCWDQPVYAAGDGEVIFVRKSEADHAPNIPPGTGGEANMIVVKSGTTYYLYVHLKKDTATVTVGQTVTRGFELGRIGNTGASSGPHLHFGVYTYEPLASPLPTGVLRPLALSLDISSATHTVPVRVPLDGAVIDS